MTRKMREVKMHGQNTRLSPFICPAGKYKSPNGLENRLSRALDKAERIYGLTHTDYDLVNRFADIIEQLHDKTGHNVVVLVDEYDKPLLETMYTNPDQEEKNRDLYIEFFSVLNDEDKYLRFEFFTGITQEELETSFQPEITALADEEDMLHDECMSELKKMYDGYHFSSD